MRRMVQKGMSTASVYCCHHCFYLDHDTLGTRAAHLPRAFALTLNGVDLVCLTGSSASESLHGTLKYMLSLSKLTLRAYICNPGLEVTPAAQMEYQGARRSTNG